MHQLTFEFVTDTATMCIVDPAAIRHRITEDYDWWTLPQAELLEVRKGNALFVSLGSDGKYLVELKNDQVADCRSAKITFPSGRIFIGAAEEVTCEGREPIGDRGGVFLDVSPGTYLFEFSRTASRISVAYRRVEGDSANQVDGPLTI